MLPGPMSDLAADRGPMRALAIGLVALWAATAVAVAAVYRPGGPLDLIVIIVAGVPVLVALAGAVWPPLAASHRHRVAVVWIWLAAVLFGIPVVYGVASTLTSGGPQNLAPSAEAAYAAVLAFFSMAVFSVTGFVHRQRRERVFERRAAILATLLAGLLTTAVGAQFVLVALINESSLRDDPSPRSRFGPADVDLVPPYCDEPIALGANASVSIQATSRLDDEVRGRAQLLGQRRDMDEAWSGSWGGPDGVGETRYLRLGRQAWLDDGDGSSAAEAGASPAVAGPRWREVVPDPFGLASGDGLTMDGPPHALVDVPRGSIVAEDLGIEVIEGAPARHCRTFTDGPTALAAFLPLRWVLDGGAASGSTDVGRWRGEMDWWVFGDGQLGRARVEVSGSSADTAWPGSGVRAVLEAELEAVDRDLPVSISAPIDDLGAALQSPAP
jgi:hypothetical protein